MTTTAPARAQPGFVPVPRATLAPRPPAPTPEQRGSPAVDVRNFSFAYGSRQILRDLTPGIRHGGDILVEGTSVFSPSTDLVALRQKVGMVFQQPNPFPKSVFDNVAYGPALNRLVPRRDLPDVVEKCLRQAALWDEVKDRLDEGGTGLSGGQQQRLCIARALGNQPEVLLMDEPCSALDPVATQRVEELIFELKKDYTIVIVTHNMQQAARVSDYTGFFDRGELIEFGETERIFTKPAHERTEAYITGRFG